VSDFNRRQLRRKPLHGRAKLSGDGEVEVRTLDISVGGIAVVLMRNLAPNRHCRIRFSVPDAEGQYAWFESEATVAHSALSGARGGFVVGLQFLNPAESLIAAVKRYVES
jgi:c-di-GMP-binding flagellar brake protein YcgR